MCKTVNTRREPHGSVANVLDKLGEKIFDLKLNAWQEKTLRAIGQCRTQALGGHIDVCTDCGTLHISYNSCRNRHCPSCQGHKKQQWIEARSSELLPVPYFHVVFTLPSDLNLWALQQPKIVYDCLFESAWKTLETFGKNKGVKMGMIAILHTWGQNLTLHPHLHCIVPSGGIDRQGHFQKVRADGKFLFSVKAMSKVFRAKYVALLRKEKLGDQTLYDKLFVQNWVVFAKSPFGNVHSVVEYLGRYTHKIAISNHRIQKLDQQEVTFNYKDYRQKGITKSMTLSLDEFTRRFAQHILPKGFVRIRHFGFLSSTWKRGKLKNLQQEMGVNLENLAPVGNYLKRCPYCKTGKLITLFAFDQRGPPIAYLNVLPSISPSI
jgi:hypothetical protein